MDVNETLWKHPAFRNSADMFRPALGSDTKPDRWLRVSNLPFRDGTCPGAWGSVCRGFRNMPYMGIPAVHDAPSTRGPPIGWNRALGASHRREVPMTGWYIAGLYPSRCRGRGSAAGSAIDLAPTMGTFSTSAVVSDAIIHQLHRAGMKDE
ncbi:hypothetical protein E4U42_001417 [Claviceps africana]|uniref:Uncharacterized protein n=1 Tax=Claviceps africana TaxID=83212 RepID=A0A8K0IZW9_9HYPO|nr:hypothetical protein E4U42_001417 [Claviceps africana]